MLPKEQDLPDAYRGDTYAQIVLTVKTDEQLADLSGATAKMAFKQGRKTALTWTSEDAQILVQPEGQIGKIVLPKQIIDIEAGKYLYDLQVTFPDGTRQTYIRGSIKVVDDVTQ